MKRLEAEPETLQQHHNSVLIAHGRVPPSCMLPTRVFNDMEEHRR